MPQYRPKDSPKTIHYRIFSCSQRPRALDAFGPSTGRALEWVRLGSEVSGQGIGLYCRLEYDGLLGKNTMGAQPAKLGPRKVGSLGSRPLRNLAVAGPAVVWGVLLLILLCSPLVLATQEGGNFAAAEKLYAAGKVSEAEALYQTIGSEDRNFAQVLRRLGGIYYLSGRLGLAEEKFARYANLQTQPKPTPCWQGCSLTLRSSIPP